MFIHKAIALIGLGCIFCGADTLLYKYWKFPMPLVKGVLYISFGICAIFLSISKK